MVCSARRWFILAGTLLLATPALWAEAPPDATKPAPKEPGAVFLTPEKYQELLDQVAKLKRPAGSEKETPSSCKLSGRVDRDLVRLRAEFEFQTLQPRALVALGCQKAQLSAASLDDGRLPVLPPPGDDGFVVQVEAPGQHRLVLEMDLPVISKGTDRSFDLNLPRAAINVLEHFDVTGALPEVRVLSVEDKRQFQQVVPASSLSSRNEQRRPLALGAVSRLEVSWKVPAPPPTGAPAREVRGVVEVRFDNGYVVTEADLTLKLRSGQTDQWKVLAPVSATLELKGPADERAPTITAPTDPKNPVWLIKCEPGNKPLTLHVRIRLPRAGKSVPVGPFAVLDAERQFGSITISAPADVRLRYHLRGDISQCEVPEDRRQDSNVVASFNYYNLPMPARSAQPPLAPLDLEIESVQGVVETRLLHTLLLTREGWRITSRIEVTPVRKAVEQLDVELPPRYQLVKPPSSILVEGVKFQDLGDDRRMATITLVQKQPAGKLFHLTLEGMVPLPADVEQTPAGLPRRLGVGLPHPVDTQDRGAEVTAAVREGLELLAPESGSDAARAGPKPLAWRTDRAPAQVDLTWRDHRPDRVVTAAVDVFLTDRQARVRHRLHFPALRSSSPMLTGQAPFLLRVPAAVGGRLTLEEGYKLAPANDARTLWAVTLPEPAEKDSAPKKELTLTLEYTFALPEADGEASARPFAVPLVWAEQATGGSTKVWVWSDPGVRVLPVFAGERWDELPTEIVAGRADRLPALVLRSHSLAVPPLSLELKPAEVPATVAERVLIQATAGDWGAQSYRARFLITRLTTRTLEVELPAPPANINLTLFFDGRRLPLQTVDESGNDSDLGKIVRLSVDPDLYRGKPVVLDLQYQLVSGRESDRNLGPAGALRLLSTFQPPSLRGKVFMWEKRWAIRLPSGWLPLLPGEGARGEQRWGWRGWFPGPVPAVDSADLESWFTGAEAAGQSEDGEPSLVCRQSMLRPIVLIHVPQQAWLLTCSLAVFAIGFVLYYVPLSRGWFWAVTIGLGLAVATAGVLWPALLPAVIYGSEPGLFVLALVLIYSWMRQRRYRRQLVFMPGFTHLKPGSSLVRTKGSERGRREPSTVDVAPAGGSEG